MEFITRKLGCPHNYFGFRVLGMNSTFMDLTLRYLNTPLINGQYVNMYLVKTVHWYKRHKYV